VVADGDVVDAGIGGLREEAAPLAGVAAERPWEGPDPCGHGAGSGLGRATQRVRATASTLPWASSSADPAGRLRPSAGPVRQATRQ
jgi:hypothetical protein